MDSRLKVSISEAVPEQKHFIELKIEHKDTGEGFSLNPSAKGLIISGHNRNGLLNGAYEFLRMQDWRWTEPTEIGEYRPKGNKIKWPAREIEQTPSFKFRCLDAYRESQDSLEYLLWMARNRLNVCFRKAASAKFADKLGMYSRTGGHLLQKMLHPDIYLESGKTIWEEHPEWYGLPADAKRIKEFATSIQLCVSQASLLKYLADELIRLLGSVLDGVDILDLWGFDTWGETCSCSKCKEKGNGADQNLFLLSSLRDQLDKAFSDGQLNRKVLLDTVAYEGTATLKSPLKPVPKNLSTAGDICIFYPIVRCYRHNFKDSKCSINAGYRNALLGWCKKKPALSIWIGEYYNVSKFEDQPLLFSEIIPEDMRFYHAAGVRGATYMHSIFVNWAMRSLTQMQHAQYSWDVNTEDKKFLEDYFSSRYDIYAGKMLKVYGLIDEASQYVSSWRNWRNSLLSELLKWDGSVSGKQLTFGHFHKVSEAVDEAVKSIELLQQAAGEIDLLLLAEQRRNCRNLPDLGYVPVNPEEAEAFKKYDFMEYRLGESRRLLVYGIDSMRLITEIMKYHTALFNMDFREAKEIWDTVESIASKMSMYFQPIQFERPGPGLKSQDALTRTQLRPVISRCRRARLEGFVADE